MGILDNLEGGGIHVLSSLIHMDLPIHFGNRDNFIVLLEFFLAML